MARIRTIKPEFFTSEDIVSLSPLARLLYLATWCEADREGRMEWRPFTFKMRYFPADSCDIKSLCQELTDAGLIVAYGDGLAYIPKFSKHQHINPREASSHLPEPPPEVDASRRVGTRAFTVTDAQGGRKEGKEGDTRVEDASSASPPGFEAFWEIWPKSSRKGGKASCLKVWIKRKLEPMAKTIAEHVKAMAGSPDWLKNGGEFIPAPLVYLNQARWDGAEAVKADDPWKGAM